MPPAAGAGGSFLPCHRCFGWGVSPEHTDPRCRYGCDRNMTFRHHHKSHQHATETPSSTIETPRNIDAHHKEHGSGEDDVSIQTPGKQNKIITTATQEKKNSPVFPRKLTSAEYTVFLKTVRSLRKQRIKGGRHGGGGGGVVVVLCCLCVILLILVWTGFAIRKRGSTSSKIVPFTLHEESQYL